MKALFLLGMSVMALGAGLSARAEQVEFSASLGVVRCFSDGQGRQCVIGSDSNPVNISIAINDCEMDAQGNESCQGQWETINRKDGLIFGMHLNVIKTTWKNGSVGYTLIGEFGPRDMESTSFWFDLSSRGEVLNQFNIYGNTVNVRTGRGQYTYSPLATIAPKRDTPKN